MTDDTPKRNKPLIRFFFSSHLYFSIAKANTERKTRGKVISNLVKESLTPVVSLMGIFKCMTLAILILWIMGWGDLQNCVFKNTPRNSMLFLRGDIHTQAATLNVNIMFLGDGG